MADDVLSQLDEIEGDAHESALVDALDSLLGRLGGLCDALTAYTAETGIPAHRAVDSAQTARWDDLTHDSAIIADRARPETD